MRGFSIACGLLLLAAPQARAQQDTTSAAPNAPRNARLLPDISVVGDIVADFSPHRSTQEDNSRFGVREVEVALGAAVDPYFRGDVFLGFSDEEGAAIEQAFLTTTSLPAGLELRLGRFLMPVGKQNTTHRHDLHSIEYPHVLQQYFGPEGLKGTGLQLSRIMAPFGFYQELIVSAVDRLDVESEEDLVTRDDVNAKLTDLGFSARLRNYWDLSQSTNLELSGSVVTGRRPFAFEGAIPSICLSPRSGDDGCVNAANVRQTVAGVDVTFRWRPLQQGLYKSFILQAELLHQTTGDADVPEPFPSSAAPAHASYTGGYAFARWQLSRRGYIGARYDFVESAALDGETLRAVSGYYEFFPSEFSKLNAGVERLDERTRILLQATFALGPHKPHPF